MRILAFFTMLVALGFSAKDKPKASPVWPQKIELVTRVFCQNKHYIVCKVNPRQYKVELFNRDDHDRIYTFQSISAKKGRALIFAMNAGMYEKDLSPVGLFVAKGKTTRSINLATDLPGNFYQLKPNGIFILDEQNTAHIITSESYASIAYRVKLATQSGPMLLINGVVNSNFNERSTNVNIRNGVGIDRDGNVIFAISTDNVTFYELARLFKERYRCDNALYMDGFVSQFSAPGLQQAATGGIQLGTFITVSDQ